MTVRLDRTSHTSHSVQPAPRRFSRFVCLVICVSLVLTALPGYARPVRAGELEDKREQLDRVNREIERYRQQIQRTRGQEKSLLTELKRLEQELEKAQNNLKYIEARLQSTQRAISETENGLKETEEELRKRNDLLKNRLKWLYKVGPIGYIEVILGAVDVQDLLSRFEMVRSIVKHDVSLATDIKQQEQEYRDKKEELEERRDELESLKGQVALKREQVTSRAADREQFLAQVKKERSEYEKALDELEELSEQLVEIIKDLQAKEGFRRIGPLNMLWPAKGAVTSRFGMRRHPILRTMRMHSGIDIGASRGSSVLAAEAGAVLHAGLLGGYGKAIIIDHGGGVSTLYAHCDTLLVSSGQVVDRGFVIGRVGSTGLSTGPHLHFEVRVNGAPNDPLKWLK
ncbi:MAG: peptidoglycan DD-metalloendopeptidase family protein [Firmicutes bacterium]|nr:peptidoglycan DD-metalloendopeptidase family protein [Bacillota bacterium]